MISSSLGGYVRIQSECWRWCSIQNGFEDHTTRVASKRKHARTHLVQHRAEREQISTSVEFFALNLLGRHIRHGAQRRAGTGQMCLGLDGRGAHGNALRLE